MNLKLTTGWLWFIYIDMTQTLFTIIFLTIIVMYRTSYRMGQDMSSRHRQQQRHPELLPLQRLRCL